jgi:putative nucleotidyltransferase with HDIG domain
MDFRLGLLKTRVARRVLALFVAGALVPVLVMGGLSFLAVRGQLESASEDRLERLAANAGQSLVQQLRMAEATLGRLALVVKLDNGEVPALNAMVPPVVEALAVVPDGGHPRPIVGTIEGVPRLDSRLLAHLAEGKMVLQAVSKPRRLLAAMALDTANLKAGILWARLTPDSIWGPANQFTALSTRADFCVLVGEADQDMYCESGTDGVAKAFRAARVGNSHMGVLRARVDGRNLITGYRRFVLAVPFATPRWTVLVSESQESVYAPLSSFEFSFPVALLFGISAVLLLANVQVRRTMDPLVALEAGTRQIAAGDLGTRIRVTSRDEFRALADSFNRMAVHLGVQFHQIEAARAIDQAVLLAGSEDEVVRALLSHFGEVVPSRGVAVLLVDDAVSGAAHVRSRMSDGEGRSAPLRLSQGDLAWLHEQPDHRITSGGQPLPSFADGSGSSGTDAVTVVLPFTVQDQVRGALWYEAPDGVAPDPEDVQRARRIADQAAVALDELRLVGELKELSWGALRALARAIDAKSEWTTGHSERVTELALDMARELDVGEDKLEILNRGGLLHDIGKIGVPGRILDMAHTLSPEDRAIVDQHPVIGGRILEPIHAFRPSLPIVTQHHEHWDGTGYPEGLAGEQIDLLARILTVADVYDAMASDRPYRPGLDPAEVVRHIEKGRGSHFDPRAVDAFLSVLARRGGTPPTDPGSADE